LKWTKKKKKKAIICVSGDGIVHEVLNGLLKRDDWKDASKIPVGVIPAGLILILDPLI